MAGAVAGQRCGQVRGGEREHRGERVGVEDAPHPRDCRRPGAGWWSSPAGAARSPAGCRAGRTRRRRGPRRPPRRVRRRCGRGRSGRGRPGTGRAAPRASRSARSAASSAAASTTGSPSRPLSASRRREDSSRARWRRSRVAASVAGIGSMWTATSSAAGPGQQRFQPGRADLGRVAGDDEGGGVAVADAQGPRGDLDGAPVRPTAASPAASDRRPRRRSRRPAAGGAVHGVQPFGDA